MNGYCFRQFPDSLKAQSQPHTGVEKSKKVDSQITHVICKGNLAHAVWK